MVDHIEYGLNDKGRDFVVGDLHGCYDMLTDELARLDFNDSTDRLFSVGDLVDRGPKSMYCLGLINEPWFYTVRGNHEDMMISAMLEGGSFHHWRQNGGDWVDQELDFDDGELLKRLCVKVRDTIPFAMTIQTEEGPIGICHAQPPSNNWNDVKNLTDRQRETVLWSREWITHWDDVYVHGIWKTIHGHTPVKGVVNLANVMYIDTGAVFGHSLTVIQI